MPRISLWNPIKGNDYKFADRNIKELFNMSATGVYVHKYLGGLDNNPDKTGIQVGSTSETFIEDVIFLENRGRKYDENVYELRGHYTPQDVDFDLSQFGIFLTSDTMLMTFHINDTIDKLGRKIMAGDVLELPHLRDDTLIDPEATAINRFFSVEEVSVHAAGYDQNWWSHIWRVKAKKLFYSEQYKDIFKNYTEPSGIFGDTDYDGCAKDISQDISPSCPSLNDALIEEAEKNVKYDPKFFESDHLWVEFDCDNMPILHFYSADGNPPNGIPLAGSGDTFPETLVDGDYFLRTDFKPERLFKKNGTTFMKVADNRKIPWKSGHRVLDTFINNTETFTNDSGEEMPVRQAISKVVKPRIDE